MTDQTRPEDEAPEEDQPGGPEPESSSEGGPDVDGPEEPEPGEELEGAEEPEEDLEIAAAGADPGGADAVAAGAAVGATSARAAGATREVAPVKPSGRGTTPVASTTGGAEAELEVDDPVSKVWVGIIVAVFVLIFGWALFFGGGGLFSGIFDGGEPEIYARTHACAEPFGGTERFGRGERFGSCLGSRRARAHQRAVTRGHGGVDAAAHADSHRAADADTHRAADAGTNPSADTRADTCADSRADTCADTYAEPGAADADPCADGHGTPHRDDPGSLRKPSRLGAHPAGRAEMHSGSRPEGHDPLAAPRQRMVREQLAKRGIDDPATLAAMGLVPREAFVPPAQHVHAYEDRALSIGRGQTISQPYMVARMTALLRLSERGWPWGETRPTVLDVGTGSGYQAAVLAQLGARVVSVERDPELAAEARDRLAALGYAVDVRVGDGSLGFEPEAPYAGIVVAAAAPRVPEPLVAQLADGARLVVPVGSRSTQRLTIVVREGRGTKTETADACVFVPLVGSHGHPG